MSNINKNIGFLGLSIALICPLSFHFGELQGKPIDFVMSDFIVPFTIVIFFLSKKVYFCKNEVVFLKLIFLNIFYFIGLSIIGTINDSSSIVPIVSSVRFLKSMLLVVSGMVLFKIYAKAQFLKFMGSIIFCYPFMLVISDIVFNSRFPSPRWGGLIGSFDIYGFPNSSAMFGVILSCFLIVKLKTNGTLSEKIVILPLFLSISLAIMSLSRNSMTSMLFCLLFFYLVLTKRFFIVGLLVAFSIIIYMFWGKLLANFDFLYVIHDGLINRMHNTLNQMGDVSGRADIWVESINLIIKKPIFGYMFEPFSNYHAWHDTPHQQYLEILYKGGLVGFLLYMSAFIYGLKNCYFLFRSYPDKFVNNFAGGLFLAGIGILYSNFFQPNMSYSITANFVWFFFGWLVAVRGEFLLQITNIATQQRLNKL